MLRSLQRALPGGGGVADGVLGDAPVTRRGRAPSGDQLYVHVY